MPHDGDHLLIADTPGTIARACARLLGDPDLRLRLTDNAHRLFVERFLTDRVEEGVPHRLRVAALSGAPVPTPVRAAIHESRGGRQRRRPPRSWR